MWHQLGLNLVTLLVLSFLGVPNFKGFIFILRGNQGGIKIYSFCKAGVFITLSQSPWRLGSVGEIWVQVCRLGAATRWGECHLYQERKAESGMLENKSLKVCWTYGKRGVTIWKSGYCNGAGNHQKQGTEILKEIKGQEIHWVIYQWACLKNNGCYSGSPSSPVQSY